MKHKFTTASGTVLYYDNLFNGLFDVNGNPLSKDHGLTDEEISEVANEVWQSDRVVHKTNDPIMLKVILGHRCNFSCGYCMQDELSSKVDGDKRAKEKMRTMPLIQMIDENLDLSHLQRIDLWGGETFLYWAEASELMKKYDREGLTYYLPTNGSIIDHHHVEFLSGLKANVAIGISHDGPAHTTTRGPEILDRQVEVLRHIERTDNIQYSFNPVISNQNYDLFKINDFFKSYLSSNGLKNVPLMFEIIQVYNLDEIRGDSASYALNQEQLAEYADIMKRYLAEHVKQTMQGPEAMMNGEYLMTNLFELEKGGLVWARHLHQQDIKRVGSKCQADQERQLTIDMNGDVRTCQNVGSEAIFGNLKELDKVAVTNLDTMQGDHCKSCRVYFLCSSQCPIKQNKEVFDTNCKINKVHYGAIQDAALSYLNRGEEITYDGGEIQQPDFVINHPVFGETE